MFFDDPAEIPTIATKVGCAVFVVPDDTPINIKNAIAIEAEDGKSTISIDQVKEIIAHVGTRETIDRYFVIRAAEKMTPDAANALLKNLEEPGEHYHFLLQTKDPSSLLPTILSRAAIFVLKTPDPINTGLTAADDVKNLAKRLIAAKDRDLIGIMNDITKKKDGVRPYALDIIATAIEISYKSFFKTGNPAFLTKLPKLIAMHDHIAKNGHVKLHLVADLL